MPTLSISHFKSIRDLEIDLGVVNIFIGANGSGKPSYTVAQRILVEGLNPNDWPLSRLWVMGHLGGVPNV